MNIIDRIQLDIPLLATTVAFSIGLTMPAMAADKSSKCINESEVRNTVLALYDSRNYLDKRKTKIHRFAELPLNYLGYKTQYIDIEKLDSDPEIPEDTAAIFSWFGASVLRGSEITSWRTQATTPCGHQPKQIVFGEPGLDPADGAGGETLLRRIGLQSLGSEVPIGHRSFVGAMDSSVIGYETEYVLGVGAYPFQKASGAAESFLSVQPFGNGTSTVLVVVSTEGAYAHDSAIVEYDARAGTSFWILNPFAFFERALGTAPRPIPDTTTQNGLRTFFSTVHSDGWLEPEPSRYFGEEVGIAAELLLGRLIAPFPELPTTVAVLHGDLDPILAGTSADRGRNAAATLFDQPHVQIATNGHDLVRNWARASADSDDASPQAEQDQTTGTEAFRFLSGMFGNDRRGATGAFRKYATGPFDLAAETKDAITKTAALPTSIKGSATFLWTRNSFPTEAAILSAKETGAATLGGGWDPSNPLISALSGLSPQAARVGNELLVYDTLGSDAAYTGNWLGDLAGFHGLSGTVQWTETPRRLKPFQLAYSARSALHFGTRSAVRKHLEAARNGPYFPITAADYVSMVEGFESIRMFHEGELRWRVADRKGLQTIRFDLADNLALDMAASSGVLGAVRKEKSLYVSLDPGSNSPVIALAWDDLPSGVRVGTAGVALAKSNFQPFGFWRERCSTGFRKESFAPGRLTAVAKPGSKLQVELPARTETAIADANGHIPIRIDDPGPIEVTLTTDCTEG